jgi:hypothetical protein
VPGAEFQAQFALLLLEVFPVAAQSPQSPLEISTLGAKFFAYSIHSLTRQFHHMKEK